MKKCSILLISAVILLGSLVSVNASYISNAQQTSFTYLTYTYWAFVYDYTTDSTEASTAGFQAVDQTLEWNNQYSGLPGNRVTHVAYIYSSNLGAFYAAMSFQSWRIVQ